MSIFIDTLKGKKTKTPIWLMRQAGRHLPEYIKIRQEYKDLMEMFLNHEVITEISLQPVKRYGLDACIMFSDILMIPYASGCDVRKYKKNIKRPLNRLCGRTLDDIIVLLI